MVARPARSVARKCSSCPAASYRSASRPAPSPAPSPARQPQRRRPVRRWRHCGDRRSRRTRGAAEPSCRPRSAGRRTAGRGSVRRRAPARPARARPRASPRTGRRRAPGVPDRRSPVPTRRRRRRPGAPTDPARPALRAAPSSPAAATAPDRARSRMRPRDGWAPTSGTSRPQSPRAAFSDLPPAMPDALSPMPRQGYGSAATASKHLGDRTQKHLDVEPQRPVLDVVVVEPGPVRDRGIPA